MATNLEIIKQYFENTGFPDFDVFTLPGHWVKKENAAYFVNSSIATAQRHPENITYKIYFSELVTYYNKVREVRKILKT